MSRVRASAVVLAWLSCVAGMANAAEPPADAVLAELPFVATGDGAPFEVRIDLAPAGSRPLPLVLDTGSPESFATPRAAQQLGISLRRSKQTPYRRATRLGRDVELQVDTRRGETGTSAGGDWAVLGARFLAAYVVEIDTPGRRVRFLDPKRFTVPETAQHANASVLPLRLVGNRPIIEVEIGATRLPAAITTGAPGTLLLPGGWTSGAGLLPDAETTAAIAPLPGAGKLDAMIAPRLRIARFEERDVPILVAEHGAQGAGARSEALLGMELLQRFVLRIDYPRKRIWIEEPAE